MALVGCTQMATDTTGLLQRMLPRLDATHLAVCIAVSKLFETSPENRNHSQAFGCCQPCLPCMTDLVLPRLQTRQQSLSGTFSIKTHNRYISTLSNTLYKSYRVHSALLLRCIGIGCSRMALVGGTQMAADVTGLLQRMLPRLDDTHLAVCIAVSKLGLTPPPDESAVAKCDFLNPNAQSMLSKAFQHFVPILSGARSFAARMRWGRMQSNGFGRLHSNGYGHNWAVATDVTKIRCYSPGGMHCSL